MRYNFGDWVVCDLGYKREIGRVTECGDRNAFVCFHLGCTAASTPLSILRPATDDEVAQAPAGIGYHRFDDACPKRNDACCGMCRAVADES